MENIAPQSIRPTSKYSWPSNTDEFGQDFNVELDVKQKARFSPTSKLLDRDEKQDITSTGSDQNQLVDDDPSAAASIVVFSHRSVSVTCGPNSSRLYGKPADQQRKWQSQQQQSWYRGDPSQDLSALTGVRFHSISSFSSASSAAAVSGGEGEAQVASPTFMDNKKQTNNSENSFLTPQDFQTAQNSPVMIPSPEELADMLVPTLFEGDILGIPPVDSRSRPNINLQQQEATVDSVLRLRYHSALNLDTFTDKLWPGRRVPYVLEKGWEEHQRVAVAQAFQEYRDKTCVEFVPRVPGDSDFIFIERNKHFGFTLAHPNVDRCSSYVGRAGGNQTISLEVGKCFTKGIVAHELMHSLGFFHEHSRTDRDKFVLIDENNIKPGMLRNFEKYPRKIVDTLDMPYDYGSVMHYHRLAFSNNGRSTIAPREPGAEIGQRYQLSAIDAAKVNKLYGCPPPGGSSVEGDREEENEEETIPSAFITMPSSLSTTTSTPPPPHTTTSTTSTTETQGTTQVFSKTQTTTKIATSRTPQPQNTKKTAKPFVKREKCRDLNDHCKMWSEIGHCRWSEKYMRHYCRKSCKICKSPSGTKKSTAGRKKSQYKAIGGGGYTKKTLLTIKGKTTGPNECSDQNLFCGYWSRIGECRRQSKFMTLFCRRSCKLCS